MKPSGRTFNERTRRIRCDNKFVMRKGLVQNHTDGAERRTTPPPRSSPWIRESGPNALKFLTPRLGGPRSTQYAIGWRAFRQLLGFRAEGRVQADKLELLNL